MAGKNFKQGVYTLKHPEKYKGDPDKVIYRSSWELQFFSFLDNNTKVLQWSSEEIAIPYLKPTDGRMHKYYPDIFVCYENRNGEIKWELIEIKPIQQTRSPRKNSKHAIYEQLTYAVNTAKWLAAKAWCEYQSMATGKTITFRLVTEVQIFK